MYPWLWSKLPGPTPVKVLEAVGLFIAVVALLFTVVFPWLEPRLPFNDVTVDVPTSSSSPSPSGG